MQTPITSVMVKEFIEARLTSGLIVPDHIVVLENPNDPLDRVTVQVRPWFDRLSPVEAEESLTIKTKDITFTERSTGDYIRAASINAPNTYGTAIYYWEGHNGGDIRSLWMQYGQEFLIVDEHLIILCDRGLHPSIIKNRNHYMNTYKIYWYLRALVGEENVKCSYAGYGLTKAIETIDVKFASTNVALNIYVNPIATKIEMNNVRDEVMVCDLRDCSALYLMSTVNSFLGRLIAHTKDNTPENKR